MVSYTNGSKIEQMAIKLYQHFSLQDTPKFTQIWIFGLKIHIPSGNPGRTRKNDVLRDFILTSNVCWRVKLD
jgi:hypothetical protein